MEAPPSTNPPPSGANGGLREIGRKVARRVSRRLLRYLSQLGADRECPLCGWTGLQFYPNGIIPLKYRFDARCPRCGSKERHRLAYVTMQNRLGKDLSMLHVAPEACLAPWLRSAAAEYVSIDLAAGTAMRQMDLRELSFPEDSFDVVWCSHVLEHIPEDGEAMREMRRVLAPGGRAVLQVPVWRFQVTEEDPDASRQERLERFYQRDHVRIYGLLDFIDCLEEAGFYVTVHRAQDLGPEVLLRHGLSFPSTNEVFVAEK